MNLDPGSEPTAPTVPFSLVPHLGRMADFLRELSRGEQEPFNRQDGICFNLHLLFGREVCTISTLYRFLGTIFVHLGYEDSENPLGDYWVSGDPWEGARGERRRKLAGEVADVLQRLHMEEIGQRLEAIGYDIDELDRDNPYTTPA